MMYCVGETKVFPSLIFLPKPNIHEMFWCGYRKSFSFLRIDFVRRLNVHNIQVHCVASDPAFYAGTTHKVNETLGNPFKRPKQSVKRGQLQDALFTFVDTKPWKVHNPATAKSLAPFSHMQWHWPPSTCSKDIWSQTSSFFLLFYHHQLWKKLQVKILLVLY